MEFNISNIGFGTNIDLETLGNRDKENKTLKMRLLKFCGA
jgi:hypothetical protein